MIENPRRGRQARNFTTNVPKIVDLKSSSEQIFFRKLSLGAPEASVHYSNTYNLKLDWQQGEAKKNASKYVTRSTRHSDQNWRKKANLVLFNQAWRPLVSSDSHKSYLILKLTAGRICQFFVICTLKKRNTVDSR